MSSDDYLLEVFIDAIRSPFSSIRKLQVAIRSPLSSIRKLQVAIRSPFSSFRWLIPLIRCTTRGATGYHIYRFLILPAAV